MRKTDVLRLLCSVTLLAVVAAAGFALWATPEAEAMGGGGQPCGGLAGLECPNPKQVCVDDPRDNCDPKTGGRDCIGICRGPGGGGSSQ